MQRLQYRQEQGFSIAEVMVVLCIVAMMLPILILEYEKGHAMRMARQAAEHLAKVNKAASEYVQAHHERLSTEASASSGPEITVAVLLHEHLLPTGFSPKNLWGQEYRIYMRKPRSNELHAIVLTTGGYRTDEPAFINTLVPTAATMLHGGGFIPSGLVPGQSSGTLQGAFGGWKLELGSVGIPSPGAGHMGTLTSFDPGNLGQDFLYRVNVPGHPELNAMQTELDMTDHAIEKVKEIQFVPHTLDEMTDFCADPSQNGRFFLHEDEGLYICRDGKVQTVADTGNSLMMKNMTLAAHGEHIPKPHCPPGVETQAEIFLSPVTYSAKTTLSPPVVSVQTWADSVSDTEWLVNLRIMTADPRNATPVWVYPTADLAQVMVMTLCRSKEGVTP